MPRNARFTFPDRPASYHIISRTALTGFILGDIAKDKLLDIIRYFSRIYFVDILGFAIMGNHWYLAVKVYPHEYADRDEVKGRFASRYGEDVHFGGQEVKKFSSPRQRTDVCLPGRCTPRLCPLRPPLPERGTPRRAVHRSCRVGPGLCLPS